MDNDIAIKILEKVTDLEQAVVGNTKEIGGLKKDMAVVKRLTLIMESEHGKKIDLLLELYSENTNKHEIIDKRLQSLEDTSFIHSIEIEQLKKSS